MIDSKQSMDLLHAAIEARDHSYSPYSNYAVGAALLAGNGQIYLGCNIENASYTPTVCAERVAFFKAIFDGVRDFQAIAIIGSGVTPAYPCGVCRQVMAEFCSDDFTVIVSNGDTTCVEQNTLGELLPFSFRPKDLL